MPKSLGREKKNKRKNKMKYVTKYLSKIVVDNFVMYISSTHLKKTKLITKKQKISTKKEHFSSLKKRGREEWFSKD